MNQTAVDWLEDNLIGNPFSEKDFAHNVNIFKQAKEMEKEQMLNFYMWMRMNEKAEEYFHYTDEDMFEEYLKQEKNA
jgi:hypothetical protein